MTAHRFPTLCLLAAVAPAALAPAAFAPAAAAPTFRFETIGLLSPDFASAQALNGAGLVVGYAGNSPTSGLPRAAVTWQGGALAALPSLGGTRSTALGVSDAGLIVGWSRDAAERTRAAVWEAGAVRALDAIHGLPAWALSFAWDVNTARQVVGVGDGPNGGRGFLLQLDSCALTALPTLGGSRSDAYGINEAGDVVGRARNAAEQTRAVLWRGGAVTDLGTLGGTTAQAWDINDRGEIAGWSTDASGARRAFLHDGVAMRALPSLGGGFDQAQDINNGGWVVGQARDTAGGSRAVLWAGGSVFDLNDRVVNGAGWVLDFAWGINDRGQVVGNATNAAGELHGFVLTPVPVPMALGLFALALGALATVRRRA
jgi:probable HAF family extracellular repeat protein